MSGATTKPDSAGSLAAELVGHAGQFHDRTDIAELGVRTFVVLVEEDVDPRAMLPGVHRHVVGHTDAIWPGMLPVVAGEFQPMLFAILVVRSSPVLDELLQKHLELKL